MEGHSSSDGSVIEIVDVRVSFETGSRARRGRLLGVRRRREDGKEESETDEQDGGSWRRHSYMTEGLLVVREESGEEVMFNVGAVSYTHLTLPTKA